MKLSERAFKRLRRSLIVIKYRIKFLSGLPCNEWFDGVEREHITGKKERLDALWGRWIPIN